MNARRHHYRGIHAHQEGGRFTSACLDVLESAPDSSFESEAAAPSPAGSSDRSAAVSEAAAAAVLAEGAAQRSESVTMCFVSVR